MSTPMIFIGWSVLFCSLVRNGSAGSERPGGSDGWGAKDANLPAEWRELDGEVALHVVLMWKWQVLRGNFVQEFPRELQWMTYLREWHVSGTKIRQLPDYLAQFTQLKILDIPKNTIAELPPEIGESPLFRLDSFTIIWQPNVSLPSTGKLVVLKELNVSYNRLCRVPPELGNCEDLQRLELTGNHLCELPFEVRQTCWCPHGYSWLLLLW